MTTHPESQSGRAVAMLQKGGMVRLSEFTRAGISAVTITRMKEKGQLVQLGRGLYQLSDVSLDMHHTLAEAAKRVPKGVVCLVSALAFHGLTDVMPPRVWMAIGSKDRKPVIDYPPIQCVRFAEPAYGSGIETHMIEGVAVRIYEPAKTVIDLFRYRQREGMRYRHSPGINLAIEGLREALRQRKATPAEIARQAEAAGIWKIVQPYLDAMTVNA